MGRLRKTDAQLRAERFAEVYRVGKARANLTEREVAQILGVSHVTLGKYKKTPEIFPFGKLITLGTMFGWTEDEFLAVAFPKRQ